MSWFDAVFGRIFSNGVELELQGGLNFTNGLRAVRNEDEDEDENWINVEPFGLDLTNPDAVSGLPYIDVRSRGAVGDGDGLGGGTDDSQALQEASTEASAARRNLLIPAGFIFRCDSPLTLPDGSHVDWQLDGWIDGTNCTDIAARDAFITIGAASGGNSLDEGGLTALPALGAHANRFALEAEFDEAHGLADGDLFIIVDTDDYSWHPGLDGVAGRNDRPYYHKGDYCRVRSAVSSLAVSLDTPLYDTYLTSDNVALLKVSPSSINIRGAGKIICPGLASLDVGLHINNGTGSIEGIEIVGARFAQLELWRCYKLDATDVNVRVANLVGDEGAGGYMISCFDCHMRDGSYIGGKHGFSLTGGAIAYAFPNRASGCEDSTLSGDLTAADMHGANEDCAFRDCDIFGGVSLGGKNATLSGGTVTSAPDYHAVGVLKGLLVRTREVLGGDFTIQNVKFRLNHLSPQDNQDCPISLDTYEAIEPGRVIWKDSSVQAGVHNATLGFLRVQPESDGGFEFLIDGLEYTGVAGQKAPVLKIVGSATAAFKKVTIARTEGIAPQTEDVRTQQLTYRDVDVSDSDGFGVVAAVIEYAGVTQHIELERVKARNCDAAGIFISGAAAANDVYATIKGCRSLNNGQDGAVSSSSKTSLRSENLKSLELTGNTWGDTQGSPTQVSSYRVATVTTLIGSGNKTLGALSRSLSSVTNDYESLELVGSVSADKGNAAATLTVGTSEATSRWDTPLTADRAVALSTTGAVNGSKFRIVRTAAATGAFNLNVGTGPLKALTPGQWCEVEYNGSAWMLTAFGAL